MGTLLLSPPFTPPRTVKRPEALSTGIESLDAILGGGFLRGQLAEISGPASCGKRSLALAFCAQTLADGLTAAWIDAQGAFSPLPALEAGWPVDRLLGVRVAGPDEALRAAVLLLRSPGAAAALVIDVEGPLRAPDAALARIRRLAEEGGGAVVFVDERDPHGPALGTFVAVRLWVRRAASRQRLPAALHVAVLKNKFGPLGPKAEVRSDGPDRLRVDSSL